MNLAGQTLNIKDSARVSCNGGSDAYLIASVSSGTHPILYGWLNSSNVVIGSDSAISGLSAGIYTVTFLDAAFTIGNKTITISAPSALDIDGPTASDAKCNGEATGWGSIDLANGGTKPYTYRWNTGDTDSLLNDVTAGTYTATVIDAKGCRDRTNVPVGEKSKITIATGKTKVSCFGGSDGSARATASGGTNLGGGTYNYSWSNDSTDNGQITSSVTNLTNGAYTVTITDFYNCTAKATITVSQPASPIFVITNKTDATCPGGNDGIAYVTPGGGTPPFYYKWAPSVAFDTDSSNTNLTAGNYTVTVADFMNCRQPATVNVADPADFVLTFDSTAVSCNKFSDGTAKVKVTGGTGGYTYSWTTGA
ncbi:MAG: SprB repeat-containing protein, partial [Bacteroidia bacterium]|nr:SprB repeat-containing protein [Bacteroidia bacterium]